MRKLVFCIMILILILAVLIFLRLAPFKKSYAQIDNQKFYVDVAKTNDQKEKGLSIYSSIKNDRGMIFPFTTPDYYTFWMKDMKFSIDIIFIRENKIVDIFENVEPPKSENNPLPTYKTKEKADTVLEINAGLSKKYKFKTQDNVIIKY